MSAYSEDGACLPSWLSVTTAPEQGTSLQTLMARNNSLRMGFVVGIHYPGDAGYEAKSEILYDVACKPNGDAEALSWHLYYNCRLGVRIGGTEQEFSRYTLRSPRKGFDAAKGLTPEQQKESTYVILQCENGLSQYGVIIGFGEHPNMGADSSSLGHNWQWNFNGIRSSINRHGEYSVTHTGSVLDLNTNTYGIPPANTAGTNFRFMKNGGWLVTDAYGESIFLDNPGKSLNLLGRSMALGTSEGDLTVKTKGKTNIKADGNAVFNSGKKVYIGKEGATDPLVLGNKLADALDKLILILSLPVLGQAGPFPCVSAIAAPLKAWGKLHAVKNISPFLSKKGYVE